MSKDLIDRKALLEKIEESLHNNPHSLSRDRSMHNHEHNHFLCMVEMPPPSSRRFGVGSGFDAETVRGTVQTVPTAVDITRGLNGVTISARSAEPICGR